MDPLVGLSGNCPPSRETHLISCFEVSDDGCQDCGFSIGEEVFALVEVCEVGGVWA